ncbi:hypothetical protein [Rhizobium straminoryzae]|uniref:Uncharacterized protein n=1 Tax=Rhizobium straminoryzae TaxID=1387186 RepID=A0A549T0S0_9HYPH|nr:hypothetical protein [Rhizobium straminoryzae]TRL35474.1 hypothetical protein FNA46_19930 [Rhizobium straminoryzae]
METFIAGLGNLIQLGGIGGSLAFLLLGYNLLRKELSYTAPGPNGTRATPNTKTLNAIKHFLKISMTYFLVGVAAQILLSVKFVAIVGFVKDWIKTDISRAAINEFEVDRQKKVVDVRIGSTGPNEDGYIPNSARDDYDIVVAFGPTSNIPDMERMFPFASGPYPFPIQAPPKISTTIEDAKWPLISDQCVKVVLFGVPKNSIKSADLASGFNASSHSNVRSLRWAINGPSDKNC